MCASQHPAHVLGWRIPCVVRIAQHFCVFMYDERAPKLEQVRKAGGSLRATEGTFRQRELDARIGLGKAARRW
eukprot:1160389-Pelagomonas_calceolata.AAC.4